MLKYILLFGCYALEIGVWKWVVFKGVAFVVVVSKYRERENYNSEKEEFEFFTQHCL